MKTRKERLSIIIPAKNEGQALADLLPKLQSTYPDAQIIVVDDGSNDNTEQLVTSLGLMLVKHPYSLGNGAAIKSGARMAQGDVLAFMDGDGQHRVEDLSCLLDQYHQGYDMVVGARDRKHQANQLRWIGNTIYNRLASAIVGQPILDLTSGMRVVNAKKFKRFLYLLPNGFSSPSTITMAFFREGYRVGYVPITVLPRIGSSHLKVFKDGLRFLLIIYKMTVYYSPLKVFLPFALLHIVLGLINYAYTYFDSGRFTNMSALLISMGVLIFLIGLVSEQVTTLIFAQTQDED